MTAPARFRKADVQRFTQGVMAATDAPVRIVADFANHRLEAIIGEVESAPKPGNDGWDDE